MYPLAHRGNSREKRAVDKPRREAWSRAFLMACRSNQSCWHLDLGSPAPRTVRKLMSVL